MTAEHVSTRRTFLAGAGAITAAGLIGAPGAASAAQAAARRRRPLWRKGLRNGIVYGSSAATWQLDPDYTPLLAREAGILFTEDDLLWYRLKPTPDAELDFSFGDQMIGFAEEHGMLVFGAHLVWDEGFGEGWEGVDMFGFDEPTARRLLFGTVRATVRRYRGRVDVWSVVNEAIGTEGVAGLRTDVPWYETIGPEYVAESFHLAREQDPDAVLLLNEFGFETVNEFGDRPSDKRAAALQVVDRLLADGVPVDAFGVQAHLLADRFAERFHPKAYRRFLRELGDRGLMVFITELDVLDDGLPADRRVRDKQVAEVYARYLDAALAEPAVKSLINFGLTDRYTWLQEDLPREDGALRRPLPFDQQMRPTRAYWALSDALLAAPWRRPFARPPRAQG